MLRCSAFTRERSTFAGRVDSDSVLDVHVLAFVLSIDPIA